MSAPPEFALLPTETLREHEEVVVSEVAELVNILRESGVVREPILVSREGRVILNGHHRYAALRALGADRVPVWLIDYMDAAVELDRWGPGPGISKAEVLERARRGTLYPPKTTRHRLKMELPSRPTPLVDLVPVAGPSGGRKAAAP